MTARQKIVVSCNRENEQYEKAQSLAKDLGINLVDENWTDYAKMAFIFKEDRLSLHDLSDTKHGVSVSFGSIPVKHGRVQVSKKQPLGKAFGSKVKTIVDATAGLGQDSFLLACMGFEVTAVERSPVVAALLQNGLERATADGRLRKAIGGRLNMQQADSIQWMEKADPKPDAVYIDPMFPPKRKSSALAKKSIRFVREIVGNDEDADKLVDAALRNSNVRVVIKRPDDAVPLVPNPSVSYGGKLVRYDVYHSDTTRLNVEL